MMALANTNVALLFFYWIMFLMCTAGVPLTGKGSVAFQTSGTTNVSKSPALYYHLSSVTRLQGSTHMTPEIHNLDGEIVRRGYVELQSSTRTNDDHPEQVYNKNDALPRSTQACSGPECTLEEVFPIDLHNLQAFKHLAGARARETTTIGGDTEKVGGELVPRTFTSALADALQTSKMHLEKFAKTLQLEGDGGAPLTRIADKGFSADSSTKLEEAAVHFYCRTWPWISFDEERRLRQTGLKQSEKNRNGSSPKQTLAEFLCHPTNAEDQGTEASVSDVQDDELVSRVAEDDFLSEQTEGKPEEKTRAATVIGSLPLQQRTPSHDGRAAEAISGDVSRSFTMTRSSLKKRTESLAQRSSLREKGAHQLRFDLPSLKDFWNIQEMKQQEQRKQQRQQHPHSALGGSVKRRLATPTLPGGKKSIYSRYLRESGQPLSSKADSSLQKFGKFVAEQIESLKGTESGEQPSPAKALRTLGKKDKTLPGGRVDHNRITKNNNLESLAQRYQRYLEEETLKLGYVTSPKTSSGLTGAAIVTGLAMLGFPLLAWVAAGFAVSDQLIQQDWEQGFNEYVHMLARQRLLKELLKEAEQESEQFEALQRRGVPVDSYTQRQQLNPSTYKFMDTDALRVLDRKRP